MKNSIEYHRGGKKAFAKENGKLNITMSKYRLGTKPQKKFCNLLSVKQLEIKDNKNSFTSQKIKFTILCKKKKFTFIFSRLSSKRTLFLSK